MPGAPRGAAAAAPRVTPLTIVSAALAGDDLPSVVATAARGLGCQVAIVLPATGTLIARPVAALDPGTARTLLEHAGAVIAATGATAAPRGVSEAVPVRIGRDVVGIVAAWGLADAGPDARVWLEAAAVAAAVSALIGETRTVDAARARRLLLQALALAPPDDPAALVAGAARLGCDLSAGAIAVCASADGDRLRAPELPAVAGTLLAEVSAGYVLGLVPSPGAASPGAARLLQSVCDSLRAAGLRAALSLPHSDPATLHDALREAEVMLALGADPDAMPGAREDTYRLLIRVLLHEPGELEQLRAQTIAPIERYDAEHDTELLATLRGFLAHHGSTTETAEAMSLHRHTVGYRLTRVQEISGLSPHESDGRERLSLGLKAHRILAADARRPRQAS